MSSDVQAIYNSLELINNIWGAPVKLAIVIYLLTLQLGIVALVPAILALISSIAIISIAKSIGHTQNIWIKSFQMRVDVMSTILGSIKSVKILSFTDWLTGIV